MKKVLSRETGAMESQLQRNGVGSIAMNLDATLDIFVENVFNYPTLAEAYKVAALDGMNNLEANKHDSPEVADLVASD